MLSLMSIFTLFYAAMILILQRGLKNLQPGRMCPKVPFTSVVIPARNEGNNLRPTLDSLIAQNIKKSAFEIIVVDDNSTDSTASILREYSSRYPNVRSFFLKSCPAGWTPKKHALHTGIGHSRGDIILTTDADCIVPPDWLSIMAGGLTEKVATVSSWVFIKPGANLLGRLEALDSLSLVLVGAAAIGLGRPMLANGANFGYRKKVFLAVGGFGKHRRLASGDDDLFIQNVYKKSDLYSRFITNTRAGIWTHANKSWKNFFQQRIRWASKSHVYPKNITILLILVYFYHIFLLSSLAMAVTDHRLLSAFIFKYVFDMYFMAKGCKLAEKKFNPFLLLLTEFLQMSYVIIAGVAGLYGRYTWKGRTYKGQKTTS